MRSSQNISCRLVGVFLLLVLAAGLFACKTPDVKKVPGYSAASQGLRRIWPRKPDPSTARVLGGKKYLVVPLPREHLQDEAAGRIARVIVDRLGQQGIAAWSIQDLTMDRVEIDQGIQQFQQCFYLPGGCAPEEVAQWTRPIEADCVITCYLLQYGEVWEKNAKVKRIVLQAACDDIGKATRIARFQSVAESRGARYSFSETEEKAADLLIESLAAHTIAAASPELVAENMQKPGDLESEAQPEAASTPAAATPESSTEN